MNAMPTVDWGHAAFTDAMWASKFEPQALGLALYELQSRVSTMKEDIHEATDFVTAGGHYRWASRMRRKSSSRNRRDITIRNSRPRGGETEIDKLHHVDLYLYAWIDDDEKLESFCVFAVKPLLDSGLLNGLPEIRNSDNSSTFVYFESHALRLIENCLIAGRDHIGQPVSFRWTTSKEYANK